MDLTFIKKSECLSDFIVDSRHYLFKMNKVNTIIEHFSGRISIIFSIIQFSTKKTERNARLQISAPVLPLLLSQNSSKERWCFHGCFATNRTIWSFRIIWDGNWWDGLILPKLQTRKKFFSLLVCIKRLIKRYYLGS